MSNNNDLLPKFLNPLEALLADAMIAAGHKQRNHRVKNAAAEPEALPKLTKHDDRYTNPDNWVRVRGVALIHRESNSLIGNFSEYTHKSVLHTRKLVREDSPIAVEGTEWVHGPQWIEWTRDEIEDLERNPEPVEIVADVILGELGVSAYACGLRVTLAYGGIAKVELLDATTFHTEDHKTAFFLPKHLSILEGMSADSKIALRAELGL